MDRLGGAERHSGNPDGFEGAAGVGSIGGQEVLLAKPQTFMNLSGSSVKALAEKHSIEARKDRGV